MSWTAEEQKALDRAKKKVAELEAKKAEDTAKHEDALLAFFGSTTLLDHVCIDRPGIQLRVSPIKTSCDFPGSSVAEFAVTLRWKLPWQK